MTHWNQPPPLISRETLEFWWDTFTNVGFVLFLAVVVVLPLVMSGCAPKVSRDLTAAQIQNLVQECTARNLDTGHDGKSWRGPTKIWCVPK